MNKLARFCAYFAQKTVLSLNVFFLPLLLLLDAPLVKGATITSVGSGNWNSTTINAPWPLGIVPSSGDNVVISSGNTINLTNSPTIVDVTINGSGILNLNTNNCTLTVNGNFTMNSTGAINGNGTSRLVSIAGNLIIAGTNNVIQNVAITTGAAISITGTLTLNTANTAAKSFGSFVNNGVFTNSANNVPLTIRGDFVNNGTFTQGTGRVTFTGAASNTVSGSAASTGFGGGITVNKGTSQSNVLEVTNVITLSNGGLTLTNGTFKLSSASTMTPFTSDPNIPANARLWNNGGTMNSSASIDWTLLGAIRVDAGSINFGTATDDRIAPNSSGATSGLVEVNGGTLSVTGRISSGTNPWIYNMTGGLTLLGTLGNTTAGRDVFNLDNSTGGVFTMSGGTLTIVNKGGSAGENLGYHNTAVLGGGFTGGVLQMGNSSTTTGSIMRVESSRPIYNMVINAPSSTVQIQSPAAPSATTALQISNDLTVVNGVLDISNQGTFIGGDWTNQSAVTDPLVQGTNSVTFNGSAAQVFANSGSANGAVFYNVLFNNTFATTPQITLNNNLTATNGLTLTAGKVNLNSNTLTLGLSGAAPGTPLRSADFLYGGTFTRWFGTTAIAIANVAGLFPMGTSAGDYRPLWVGYSSNLTTAGVISVVHSPTYPATYVAASHTDASWGNTLQGVSNSLWTISTSTLAFNGSTGIVRYGGTGFGVNTLTDLDASLLASVIGTHGAATNVNTTYEVNRTALSTANIANSWRIGTRNTFASPLPISLLEFKAIADEDDVDLIWSTASEKNNSHFDIEHSLNGLDFTEIDSIPAAGNSNMLKNYFTEDHAPAKSINYYRLKQTDFDGKISRSHVVAVQFNGKPFTYQVYPNPAKGVFTFKTNALENEIQSLEITNALGQNVYFKNGFTSDLDLSDKADGIYYLRIKTADKTFTEKLVVKNK